MVNPANYSETNPGRERPVQVSRAQVSNFSKEMQVYLSIQIAHEH